MIFRIYGVTEQAIPAVRIGANITLTFMNTYRCIGLVQILCMARTDLNSETEQIRTISHGHQG